MSGVGGSRASPAKGEEEDPETEEHEDADGNGYRVHALLSTPKLSGVG